jgi:hypothetical protein
MIVSGEAVISISSYEAQMESRRFFALMQYGQ